MLKKISKYWVCQLAGWGASMAISTFFYLTLSVRKVDNFLLLILISIVLGILITHLMRMVIREYKVLEKPIQTQIIAFIILVLVKILFICIYLICRAGWPVGTAPAAGYTAHSLGSWMRDPFPRLMTPSGRVGCRIRPNTIAGRPMRPGNRLRLGAR